MRIGKGRWPCWRRSRWPRSSRRRSPRRGTQTGAARGADDVKHVFLIVLENHSEQSVIGAPNAPFITSLAHEYAPAASYYGVTHPSEPNYVALISGSNWWAGDPDIDPAWRGDVYGGGLVPAIVVTNKDGKTGGYESSTPYNHYSLLATIEQIRGLPKLAYAADAAQVTPMTEFLSK
jgi:hypothetical protein